MRQEIKIPTLGESIQEVTIGSILKPAGAQVVQDDELVEVETDKVNQVLYAPASGIVSYTVKTGDTVKVGDVIGSIDVQKVEEKKEAPKEKKSHVVQAKKEWLEELEQKPVEKPAQAPIQKPVAKSVVAAVENKKPLSSLRKAMRDRLLQVTNTTAMLTTFNEVDMSEVIKLRKEYKDAFIAKYKTKLGFMSFFVKAVVSALQEYPEVNSYLEGDYQVFRKSIDISVAVASERGLIVPVLRGADKMSFAEIEQAIDDIVQRASKGSLSRDELVGGSFTITNGGIFGSMLSTPILNPPQCAILGMHNITKRAVVVNDEICVRPMMYLALSYDHQVLDGKQAVSFLVHIKNMIEDPHRLELGV